ncbi:hypothetical protein PR048_005134 [Dryococelus australis]|uniref:Uncharacterized protein n=1 Tax=Dryococelus australis TaxID=614101 RepID=A0ABQ9I9G6_9NEOP|nr:hypothetical protein PR048_005134 [Dryococelus australis]
MWESCRTTPLSPVSPALTFRRRCSIINSHYTLRLSGPRDSCGEFGAPVRRYEETLVVSAVWSCAGMKWVEETGNPRENLPTSGIVRHDSQMRKSGSDPAVD